MVGFFRRTSTTDERHTSIHPGRYEFTNRRD